MFFREEQVQLTRGKKRGRMDLGEDLQNIKKGGTQKVLGTQYAVWVGES